MRTNVDIDDKLMEEAQRLSGLKTKREVIDAALRVLVRLRKANITDLAGKVQWEGDLEGSREGRSYP